MGNGLSPLFHPRPGKEVPLDPETVWAALIAAVRAEDTAGSREAAETLRSWLARGGFPPRILGIPALDRAMSAAACRSVLEGDDA